MARINQHVDSKYLDANGNPTVKVRTDVDIPDKGVHKSVVQQLALDSQVSDNGSKTANIAVQDNNNVSN